jgi:hypothetical protein
MNKQPLLIQDAYDFAPPPPKLCETPWEKLYRFFFGDDIFISYSRADAIRYVPGLAARLTAKRHICFFDQLAADPSEGLPEGRRRARGHRQRKGRNPDVGRGHGSPRLPGAGAEYKS